jgi:superfamily II DNA/RNA helicase
VFKTVFCGLSFYFSSTERQTILFSATMKGKENLEKHLNDLARLSLRKSPFEVHIDEDKPIATVEGLEQVHSFSHLNKTKFKEDLMKF